MNTNKHEFFAREPQRRMRKNETCRLKREGSGESGWPKFQVSNSKGQRPEHRTLNIQSDRRGRDRAPGTSKSLRKWLMDSLLPSRSARSGPPSRQTGTHSFRCFPSGSSHKICSVNTAYNSFDSSLNSQSERVGYRGSREGRRAPVPPARGFYSIAGTCKRFEVINMKTALLLSLACAAALISGCSSTNQGATEDTYNIQTGSAHETEPVMTDPSLPLGPGDPGPQIPPP